MKNEKNFFSRLCEHFATKRKLNKMTIKYEVACEERDNYKIRCDSEKKVREHMKEAYENSLKELTKEKNDLQLIVDKKIEELKTTKNKLREYKKKSKKEKQNEK